MLTPLSQSLPAVINRVATPNDSTTWLHPGEKNFKFQFIEVLLECDLKKHLKDTALYIASSFYSGGEVAISNDALSRQMGLTTRTVINNVNGLVKLGWLSRRSGRRGIVNEYQGLIPDHLPSVRDAMARIEARRLARASRTANAPSPDLVLRFITRLYENKGLAEHLESDLLKSSMNNLRMATKRVLEKCDEQFTLAQTVIATLSTWPLPESVGDRPSMFAGAVSHVLATSSSDPIHVDAVSLIEDPFDRLFKDIDDDC